MKAAIIHSVLLLGYGIAATAQGQAPQFTISTLAGNGAATYSGDSGPAISAGINPNRVAVDAAGNLYVADVANHRIRKISAAGVISTLAGTGVMGFGGDGGPAATALLNGPTGVVLDAAGNLYVADAHNSRIRKITPGGTITTVAGNGSAGYSGDGGPAIAATLDQPSDLALDDAGNLLIADTANNRVRRVTPSGTITTIAGNGVAAFSGDGGPAANAALNSPRGIAIDSAGNIFIADQGNQRIRKVSGGVIATVAGNGTAGYAGDGGPAISAKLSTPTGIAVDASGNLYIADQDNNRVRVLLSDGTISTVAGNGAPAFAGDAGPAAGANLSSPRGIATLGGNLYIADEGNNRIRLLTPVPEPPTIYTSGVVPACSKSTSVQSGAWISLYGTNFAQTTAVWNGDFPTKLAGTTVTINGKPAYIWFVSPGQINVQAPDDSTVGAVAVVITTPYGSFSSTVTLSQYSPCFSLFDSTHAAAIVSTAGPGNSGAGYDIIGPVGAFSFPTRPLVPGEIVTLFGVGFGATNPAIPAGQLVTAPAQSVVYPQISIGGISAQVLYAGIVEAGLFQFNVVVPNAPSGDQQLLALVSGVPTPITTVITMQ